MKLTTTHVFKRKAGMTLIELTVVILVLLALIAVLFVGAKAYKAGADKAACVMNLRNVQQAVRSEANLTGLAGGAALASTVLVTKGYFGSLPVCPTGKAAYTYTDLVPDPAAAALYTSCTSVADHNPAAADIKNW